MRGGSHWGLLFVSTMIELVVLGQNDQPVTTSVLVAQKFGKRHAYVIEAVRNLIDSTEKSAQFFMPSTYVDDSGKENVMYVMNRDGFTLLAMGFTGKKALKFKMDYISAFNAMESELKKRASAPTPTLTPAEMFLQNAQLMVEQERRIKQIESRLDAIESERKETIKQLSNAPLSNDEVPEITLRNRVRRLVNKYAVAHNIRQDFVWNKVYEQLFYIYGVSIRRYKREKGATLLDVAEKHNHIEKIYAIISGMINADNQSSN